MSAVCVSNPASAGPRIEQDNLLARARLEAEDAQRALLGALNGLAGLMLLDDKPEEAVATFREGLAIGARFMCSLDGGNNPGAAAAINQAV